MWEYIAAAATCILALLGLWKDWSAHRRPMRQYAFLFTIFVLFVSTLFIVRSRLVPPPIKEERAELVATLGRVTSSLDNVEVKEKLVSRRGDGVVDISVLVVNKSRVRARNGTIYIEICETCEFAEEPKGFRRANGAPNQQRLEGFEFVDPLTAIAVEMRLKTPDPPPGSRLHKIGIGLTLRCENCAVQPTETLWVGYEHMGQP